MMNIEWLAGLTGFALAMAATPGPNNAMVAASGASYGVARTFPAVSGIGVGVAAIMLMVAAFGVSLVADPRIGFALKWAGAAYLLWLAWKIAKAEPETLTDTAPTKEAPLSFVRGALFQFVNPKLWIMVSGAVATYGQQAGEAGKITLPLVFASVCGGLTFLSALTWSALGASMGRLLASRRSVRAFNVMMAALLVASLIPLFL